MFFKTLKWNLCIFTIFIIKPEVVTECIRDDCSSSYEGLHVPWPSVSCTCHEPVLPPARAIWWHYFGWHASTLSPSNVPQWWRVQLLRPPDTNVLCGVWSFKAIISFYYSPEVWFFFFFYQLDTTPGPCFRVHSYLSRVSWAWASSRRRMWRRCTQCNVRKILLTLNQIVRFYQINETCSILSNKWD